MLRLYLGRLGVELKTPQVFPMSDELASVQILTETLSPSLLNICAMALEYSNNLFAESLMLSTAKSQKPEVNGLLEASEVMHNWFKESYPELDWEGSYFENGSGLSLNSRISAQTLTELLVEEHKSQFLNRTFWSLLSITGQTGWLKNRLMEDEVNHRIFAKTGSLDFVHNISGYFISMKNKKYAFTLMISNIEKRKRAEKLKKNSRTYKVLYRQARNYRNRALKLANELMTHWVQQL
jgi:D-alanyl-D-alanine carboxypeptidase/D-alanyl-D-alanine-endopeptidase (penicillin-binding protein 4)